MSQKMRSTSLQGSRTFKGRGCVFGPLRRQILGLARETWPEAYRALSAGRGRDEKGCHRHQLGPVWTPSVNLENWMVWGL